MKAVINRLWLAAEIIVCMLIIAGILRLLGVGLFSSVSLPEATAVLEGRNASRPAFYFVETSGGGVVSARQACAVESAALLHPEADVFLLLLTPQGGVLERSPSLRRLLEHYPNVQVLRLRLDEFFRDGPLEQWYQLGLLDATLHRAAHTSHVVRFYTLWKYGGTYLDLDVVLMLSLKGLKKFAAAQDKDIVSAGLMHMERGSRLAADCVDEIRFNFRGDVWSANGPDLITRLLRQRCGTNETTQMTPGHCQCCFQVLPAPYFFPLPPTEWKPYFDYASADSTMTSIAESYAIYVWSLLSSKADVRVGSRQPYAQVAAKSCPEVYFNCGALF